jgi:hypothetical protein
MEQLVISAIIVILSTLLLPAQFIGQLRPEILVGPEFYSGQN